MMILGQLQTSGERASRCYISQQTLHRHSRALLRGTPPTPLKSYPTCSALNGVEPSEVVCYEMKTATIARPRPSTSSLDPP